MCVQQIRLMILLVLALMLLVGCRTSEATKNEEKPTVAFLAYDLNDKFIQMIEKVVKKASVDRANLISQDAENNQGLQEKQAGGLSGLGVKSVIVNIVERTEGEAILKVLKEKNIPVVFINREPEESVISDWDMAYYVGANPLESGRMSVEILIDYFDGHRDADRNLDGLVQYVVLMGESGNQDTVYRTQAYKEVFDESDSQSGIGGQELIRVTAGWDRNTAREKMKDIIAVFGEQIEAVLANNDEMALGAIDALKEAGYFGPGNRFIPVVGVDGLQEALVSVAQGVMLGTVLSDTVSQGVDALYIAAALANEAKPVDTSVRLTSANGLGPGRYIWVPYHKVTKENYRGYLKNEKQLLEDADKNENQNTRSLDGEAS